jgi:xanthine dehydrogenase accessory factor
MDVEGIHAVRCKNATVAADTVASGTIAVLVDPEGSSIRELSPNAVVDAILAKRNVGTTRDMAPIVIGVGPGFHAGTDSSADCHAAVETKRGHYLGRVIYDGSPIPNTGVPGNIGGFSTERVLRAPTTGTFEPVRRIGDVVKKGDLVATVNGAMLYATIDGVLRGLLQEGVPVTRGMKSGDIDPRCKVAHCFSCSDKARAVGGGVLEALLHFSGRLEG